MVAVVVAVGAVLAALGVAFDAFFDV